MKKRIKECENIEFIPEQVRDIDKLDVAERNILGTLCFYYLSHSIYAAKNDGWFFKDQKTIIEESNLSEAQGKRVLLKLILKRKIERVPGTNHKCTHYRLSKEIRELMPQNPETDDVDFETFANEPLEKKRLDESSPEETRRDEFSLFENKRMFNHKMSDETKEIPIDDFDYSDVNQDTLEEYDMVIQNTCIPSEEDCDEEVPLLQGEEVKVQMEGVKDDNKDSGVEMQEFQRKKQLVVDRIREEASGKDYSGINKLTIPMYTWVSSKFPGECERFKRVVDSTLQKFKGELLAGMPSSAPVVPTNKESYPF